MKSFKELILNEEYTKQENGNLHEAKITSFTNKDFIQYIKSCTSEINKIGASWNAKVIDKSYDYDDSIKTAEIMCSINLVSTDKSVGKFSLNNTAENKVLSIVKRWFKKGFNDSKIESKDNVISIEAFIRIED